MCFYLFMNNIVVYKTYIFIFAMTISSFTFSKTKSTGYTHNLLAKIPIIIEDIIYGHTEYGQSKIVSLKHKHSIKQYRGHKRNNPQ